jgi:hypothetical protein
LKQQAWKERRLSNGRAVLALVIAATACVRASEPLPGYTPAPAKERASVVYTVEDYYAMRERAAVTGDATELFTAHPALAQHEDRRQGINTETFFVERARLAQNEILYMSHILDGYHPISVFVRDDSAVAFVHGLEVSRYTRGGPGAGEIFVRFDLRRLADRWVIERTDEQVMGERPSRTPAP